MGVAGEFVSGIFDYGMQEEAQSYDKLESERAYNRSIKERDYMNKYNSPLEQIKRFKEAGLNPNLAYGQGTPGNQPGAIAKYEAQKGRVPKLNTTLGVLQMAQQKAEIDNINANTESTKLDNSYKEDTMINRTNIKHQEWTKNHWELNKIINEGQVQHENSKEIQKMAMDAIRNNWKQSQFDGWLADRRMTKHDELVARKAFDWAQKSGFDKALEAAFIKQTKNRKSFDLSKYNKY